MYFFFQAEDGIRDYKVTGVQTCALPIFSSKSGGTVETDSLKRAYEQAFTDAGLDPADHLVVVTDPGSPLDQEATNAGFRSEERRVGKECGARWRRERREEEGREGGEEVG